MTAPAYGPSRAGGTGIIEIEDLRRRIQALEDTLNTMIQTASRELTRRLEDELATWGDVPDRLARVEDLLSPLTVDPTGPDVEWSYRRSDGILRPVPADPEERLALITAGVPLTPVVRNTREDGRMVVLPLPEMAKAP